MTSLQIIIISGAQGLLMLMGSNGLIKMTRPQNIKIKEHCFMAWPCLLYQHLDTNNSNVCSKVIVTKTFIKPILNLSKAGSPAVHFDFSSFQ